MSKGFGKIERAIIAAFTANLDAHFTTSELCGICYPGIWHEKRHRVAVLRAVNGLSSQSYTNPELPGILNIYTLYPESWLLRTVDAVFINRYSWRSASDAGYKCEFNFDYARHNNYVTDELIEYYQKQREATRMELCGEGASVFREKAAAEYEIACAQWIVSHWEHVEKGDRYARGFTGSGPRLAKAEAARDELIKEYFKRWPGPPREDGPIPVPDNVTG